MEYNQRANSMWVASVAKDSIQRRISIWDAFGSSKNGQTFVNGEVATGAIKHRIVAGCGYEQKEIPRRLESK